MPLWKRLWQPGPRGLCLLLVAVASAHLWFRSAGPEAQLWGDELSYAQHAARDARRGETSVLPGLLPFRTQPELAARVFAKFGQGRDRLREVALFHTVLLILLLTATYGQARVLGLGRAGALTSAGLLGAFPWFAFHVHSLWPEVLHAFLFGCVLLCLLLAMERDRLGYLVPAGAAAALALLAKGVLQPFLPVFAVVLGFAFARRAREADRSMVWKRALLAPGLFLGTVLVVLAPQLIANQRAGHGFHLAANRWWNLEVGLTADPAADRSVNRISREYFAASPDDITRERLARDRTLRYLREQGFGAVVARQTRELGQLLLRDESSFERSLGKMERWGSQPPTWLEALRGPARVLWYALLGSAVVGLALFRRRGPGWVLVGSFTVLFFVAAAAIPLKVRFLIPVVPVLCLYAGGVLESLSSRLRSRETSKKRSA